MRIALCLTGLLGGLNGKSGEGKIIDPRNGLFWYKKNVIEGNNVDVFFHSWNDGNNRFMVALQNDDTLQVRERASASTSLQIDTNRKFRDTNAWYHIVIQNNNADHCYYHLIKLFVL